MNRTGYYGLPVGLLLDDLHHLLLPLRERLRERERLGFLVLGSVCTRGQGLEQVMDNTGIAPPRVPYPLVFFLERERERERERQREREKERKREREREVRVASFGIQTKEKGSRVQGSGFR